MNKKGFTLIELLGVIVILALLVITVSTNGFGLLNKTKGAINKIKEENIMEAARVFLVDVENGTCINDESYQGYCDIENYIRFRDIEGNWDRHTSWMTIQIKYLIDNGYIQGNLDGCDENLETLYLDVWIEKENEDINSKTLEYHVEKQYEEDIICKN